MQGQSLQIEMIEKRAMRTIFPETDCDTAITIAKIDQLKDRHEQHCRILDCWTNISERS